MIIDRNTRRADPEKIQGLYDMKMPTTYKTLMGFLGLLNYNRTFLHQFMDLAQPLYKICSKYEKSRKFTVEDQAYVEEHVNIVRDALINHITLAHTPDDLSSVEWIVTTDASQIGMGAVLAYVNDDGEQVPVSTFRNTYNSYEMNYSIPKKECYAMIAACKHWQDILMHVPFTILTDHRALIYINNPNNSLGRTLSTWLGELSAFNYRIQHISGKDNHWSDWLSRYGCEHDPDNSSITEPSIEDQMALKFEDGTDIPFDEVEFINAVHTISAVTRSAASRQLEQQQTIEQVETKPSRFNKPIPLHVKVSPNEQILESDDENDETVEQMTPARRLLTKLKNQKKDNLAMYNDNNDQPIDVEEHEVDVDVDQDEDTVEFKQGDKLPYKFMRYNTPYIIPSISSQWELLTTCHAICHDGVDKMVRRIVDHGFFWKGMQGMALQITHTCHSCIAFNDIGKYKYLTSHSPDVTAPWERLQIDLSGPKDGTNNNNKYILVIVDVFTGFCVFEPLQRKDKAVIEEKLTNIFRIMGNPKIVQSDNGGEFENLNFKEFFRKQHIKHVTSAPHNPSTNGRVENMVKQINQIINKFRSENSRNDQWDQLLPALAMAINTRASSRLKGYSPFFAMHFRDANKHYMPTFKPISATPQTVIDIDTWLGPVYHLYDELQHQLELHYKATRKEINEQLNNSRFVTQKIPAGAIVFKKNMNLGTKADVRWLGPYRVVGHDKFDNHILATINSDNERTNSTISAKAVPRQHLKVVSFKFLDYYNKLFVVDRIINHRTKTIANKSVTEYLVTWQGYDEDDATWEPIDSFDDESIISGYHAGLKTNQQQIEKINSIRQFTQLANNLTDKLNQAHFLHTQLDHSNRMGD